MLILLSFVSLLLLFYYPSAFLSASSLTSDSMFLREVGPSFYSTLSPSFLSSSSCFCWSSALKANRLFLLTDPGLAILISTDKFRDLDLYWFSWSSLFSYSYSSSSEKLVFFLILLSSTPSAIWSWFSRI